MKSNRPDIQFLPPNIERDAPFAHSWFIRPEGRATLLSMGNTESEIEESTLENQKQIIQEFLDLEKEGKQITRSIIADDETIGFIWIELFENHGVKAPSVHIMIGNPDYRGKGIGRTAMQSAFEYIHETLHYKMIYTRHLAHNLPIAELDESLGFIKDGESYKDKNGLVWQNIKKNITSA